MLSGTIYGGSVRAQYALASVEGESVRSANAYKGRNKSTPDPSLASYDSRFQYIFMAEERGLDLPQFNTETATFHLPVEPADKAITAVRSNRHAVSCAVIPLAFLSDEAALGIFRAIPITTHQRVTAGEQFASRRVQSHRRRGRRGRWAAAAIRRRRGTRHQVTTLVSVGP
jgi:hypothetical protein